MKRKYITNTYLRDIEKYQIKLFLDEEDYYISVKKYPNCTIQDIVDDYNKSHGFNKEHYWNTQRYDYEKKKFVNERNF